MITEPVEMTHASRNHAMGRHRLLAFMALVFTLTFSPTKAHAQIIGELDANIPFQFHVGNTKFPAGKDTIRQFDEASNSSDTLSNNSNKNIQNLDKDVAKMFKQFPPGSSKK